MRLRYLPPARSPVTLRAVLAGLLPRRSALERVVELIAAECAPDAVLLTDSGTSALRLALEAVTRQRGKDATIALPAWCCYDVATAADGAGVRVALYDLDPSTLSPDLDSLERVLARGASAVVVAHLYGYPVELGAVRDLADRAGALLIEDAAQGVGGRYEGRPLGGHAPLAVLSFGRGKGRTGGGGGALLARGERGRVLFESVELVAGPPGRGVGPALRLGAQWVLARPELYRLPASLPFLGLGETPYHAPREPRLMAGGVAGALALDWEESAREVSRRQDRAAELASRLSRSRTAVPIRPVARAQPGYLRFPLLLPTNRVDPGGRALGIIPGYPRALADLPGFGRRCERTGEACHGARELAARLCTLPTHSWVRNEDLDALESWLDRGTLPAATL